MIFFTATACPVSWSFAELSLAQYSPTHVPCRFHLPHEAERAHANGLEIGIPNLQSATLAIHQDLVMSSFLTHRLVISKVVPKIWARTNSAILPDVFAAVAADVFVSVCACSETMPQQVWWCRGRWWGFSTADLEADAGEADDGIWLYRCATWLSRMLLFVTTPSSLLLRARIRSCGERKLSASCVRVTPI